MFYKKTLMSLAFLLCLGTTFPLHPAKAEQPMFIEFLGFSGCRTDDQIRNTLFDIIKNDPGITLISCLFRENLDNDGQERDPYYASNLCNTRKEGYKQKLRTVTPISVIINGHLIATTADISLAMKASRSLLSVEKIALTKKDDLLNITLPDTLPKNKSGTLYLSAYAPSHPGEKIFPVTPPSDGSVPEKKEQTELDELAKAYPKKLKPMIFRTKLADWHGKTTTISYPLGEIKNLYPKSDDLSYVVVLRDGDEFSPVLAVGEWVSMEEKMVLYPSSTTSKF